MTIKELKVLLENEPDDKLVIMHGHEGEYDDVNKGTTIEIVPNANKNIWYYGTHVQNHQNMELQPGQKVVKALLLSKLSK